MTQGDGKRTRSPLRQRLRAVKDKKKMDSAFVAERNADESGARPKSSKLRDERPVSVTDIADLCKEESEQIMKKVSAMAMPQSEMKTNDDVGAKSLNPKAMHSIFGQTGIGFKANSISPKEQQMSSCLMSPVMEESRETSDDMMTPQNGQKRNPQRLSWCNTAGPRPPPQSTSTVSAQPATKRPAKMARESLPMNSNDGLFALNAEPMYTRQPTTAKHDQLAATDSAESTQKVAPMLNADLFNFDFSMSHRGQKRLGRRIHRSKTTATFQRVSESGDVPGDLMNVFKGFQEEHKKKKTNSGDMSDAALLPMVRDLLKAKESNNTPKTVVVGKIDFNRKDGNRLQRFRSCM